MELTLILDPMAVLKLRLFTLIEEVLISGPPPPPLVLILILLTVRELTTMEFAKLVD
jgi:hypothetical protein